MSKRPFPKRRINLVKRGEHNEMDGYIEYFVTLKEDAILKAKQLSEDYSDTGYYSCVGAFIVWARKSSRHE